MGCPPELDNKLIRRTAKFLHNMEVYQNKLISIRDEFHSSHIKCYFVMPLMCFFAMVAYGPLLSYFREDAGVFGTVFPLFLGLAITSVITGPIQYNYDLISYKLSCRIGSFVLCRRKIKKHLKNPNAQKLEKIRGKVVKTLRYA